MKPCNFPGAVSRRQNRAVMGFALRSQKPGESEQEYKAYCKRANMAHENTLANIASVSDPRSVGTKKRRAVKGKF